MLRQAILAAAIGAMLVIAAASWDLHNWRAVAYIAVAALAILIAGMLPYPASAIAQAALWGASTYLLLNAGRYLSGLSRQEYAFVAEYIRLIGQIERNAAHGSVDPAIHVAEFERIANALRDLPAPPVEWTEFRDAASNELQRRLTIMRLTVSPSPETMRIAQAEWKPVERRFRQLVEERTSFWAGWPLRT